MIRASARESNGLVTMNIVARIASLVPLLAVVALVQDTGTVSHAHRLKGWFVILKDSRNSRAGHSLWGDGWGW